MNSLSRWSNQRTTFWKFWVHFIWQRMALFRLDPKVKQCSIYLGKIRPNWHGWLYCVFAANAKVNIPTFWLPIEKRYVSPQPHNNFTLFFSDLYLLAMIASRLSIVTSRVTTRPSSLPIISWSCSTLSSKDSWPSPKISCKWWTWSILKQWIGWKFCLR